MSIRRFTSMREVKRVVDPGGVVKPGKIFTGE
jgi:hypothetical protein